MVRLTGSAATRAAAVTGGLVVLATGGIALVLGSGLQAWHGGVLDQTPSLVPGFGGTLRVPGVITVTVPPQSAATKRPAAAPTAPTAAPGLPLALLGGLPSPAGIALPLPGLALPLPVGPPVPAPTPTVTPGPQPRLATPDTHRRHGRALAKGHRRHGPPPHGRAAHGKPAHGKPAERG